VVIVPIPPKKDWRLRNKAMSFRYNSTINLACTTQPNFYFFKLLLIEILKHPSASIRPVINQGFNLLFSLWPAPLRAKAEEVEICLKINILEKFNI
jgi:hypothetical protein